MRKGIWLIAEGLGLKNNNNLLLLNLVILFPHSCR